METLLIFIAGLITATIVSYFIGKQKCKAVEQATELKLRAESSEQISRLQMNLANSEQKNAGLIKSIEECKADKEQSLNRQKTEMQESFKNLLDEQQNRFDEVTAKFFAQTKNVTADILSQRQKEFTESSSQSIGNIINPLKESISKMKEEMEKNNTQQVEMKTQMRDSVEQMMRQSEMARKSADELANAFRHGNKVQGDWGEVVLKDLLESQGLKEGVNFFTQHTLRNKHNEVIESEDGSRMRPDVIVNLDQNRSVIIDSKVSMSAFFDYVNAEDEATRNSRLADHIRSIENHVKELSKKNYSKYAEGTHRTMDYVIMFVPNSNALWLALNSKSTLWHDAMNQNVYIADEQTLYGALRIINLLWIQQNQVQNQEKVFQLAEEMITRVGKFYEHYKVIGKRLESAKEAYDEGQKKLEAKGMSIVKTASDLVKLGAKDNNGLLKQFDFDDEIEIPAIEESTDETL